MSTIPLCHHSSSIVTEQLKKLLLDIVFFKIIKIAGTLRVHFQAHWPTCPRCSRREHRVLQYLDFTVSHFSMFIYLNYPFFTEVFVYVNKNISFLEDIETQTNI